MKLHRMIVAGLAALALTAPGAYAQSSPLHRWSLWTTSSTDRYGLLAVDHSKVLHICD